MMHDIQSLTYNKQTLHSYVLHTNLAASNNSKHSFTTTTTLVQRPLQQLPHKDFYTQLQLHSVRTITLPLCISISIIINFVKMIGSYKRTSLQMYFPQLSIHTITLNAHEYNN